MQALRRRRAHLFDPRGENGTPTQTCTGIFSFARRCPGYWTMAAQKWSGGRDLPPVPDLHRILGFSLPHAPDGPPRRCRPARPALQGKVDRWIVGEKWIPGSEVRRLLPFTKRVHHCVCLQGVVGILGISPRTWRLWVACFGIKLDAHGAGRGTRTHTWSGFKSEASADWATPAKGCARSGSHRQ